MENKMLNSHEISNGTIEPHVTATSGPYLFTTSTVKLVLMSICTFGIYDLYWFYKNWVLIKKRTGEDIMPFWRAFFAPIWAYSCFKNINELAAENGINVTLSIGPLAISYFILQASVKLPNPYWMISFLTFAPILPANQAALIINKHLISNFNNNDKFTVWNWAGLIAGGSLFFLGLLGIFMPFKN